MGPFNQLRLQIPDLNKALKGAKNSQHTKGQAADIVSDIPHGLAELVLQKK